MSHKSTNAIMPRWNHLNANKLNNKTTPKSRGHFQMTTCTAYIELIRKTRPSTDEKFSNIK